MPIRFPDLNPYDIYDAPELSSNGSVVYLTLTVVSTVAPNIVNVALASDGEGILTGRDHPVHAANLTASGIGDWVDVTGTSGGAGNGTFQVATVVSDTQFTINGTVGNSTGGSANFRYPAGASQVGYSDFALTPTSAALQTQEALDALKAAASTASMSFSLVNQGPINNQKPTHLAIIGTTLWYYENGNGAPAICAYDISTPSTPSFLSRHSTLTEGYLNYSFLVVGTRGYVPVQDTHSVATGGILIYDLSNGVSGANLLGYYRLLDAGAKPYDLALDSTTTYAVLPSNLTTTGKCYILNISNPASITPVATFGSASPNNRYLSVAWVENYIFACSETNNILEVWNVTTVSAPSLVTSVTFSSDATASLVRLIASPDGNSLFLYRDGPNLLTVYDISTPTSPTYVTDLPFGSVYLDQAYFGAYFSAEGTELYLGMNSASTDPGVCYVIDVQNRAAPRFIAQVTIPVGDVVGAMLPHPTQPYAYLTNHTVGQLNTYSIAVSPRKYVPAQPTKVRSFTSALGAATDIMSLQDFLVTVTATAAAATEYLPDARSCFGQTFKVVKSDSSANTVTVKTTVALQNIGIVAGTTGIVLATQGNELEVTSDGSNFWVNVSTTTPTGPTADWAYVTAFMGV